MPYPPIEAHGVIGDRRTAALVAADGTLDWLCLPNYDGSPVFAALLDADRGGFCRLGPATPTLGHQRYEGDSMVLATTWELDEAGLELTDAMAFPQAERATGEQAQRVVLRRLRCTRGKISCSLDVRPGDEFDAATATAAQGGGAVLRVGEQTLRLWSSCTLTVDPEGARASVRLRAGQEVWAVLSLGDVLTDWTARLAEQALHEAIEETRQWAGHVTWHGPREALVRRASQVVHLLHYVPTKSLVAAPTTSLPERIGGDRNYDYRFAWVRDASLSLGILTMLGDVACAEAYLRWLSGLSSATDAPLQVVYGVNGETDLTQRERTDVAGYRGSLPVRFGNRAWNQRQLDSLGYLADCAWIYLDHGGTWHEDAWPLIRGAAEYTVANWQRPDSGIWELPETAHYVSSKVMSWVTLERSVRIAERTGHPNETASWRAAMDLIRAQVMDRGWNARRGAFVQRYDSEALDASALLIPIMGFLPGDHPRVLATLDRIAETLTIDGFVHRFLAGETPGHGDLPLGELEGAFLPCTFWLVTAYAMAGRREAAEVTMAGAEALAGELGLFAEEVDARSRTFRGNTPLLFSQMEYVRAALQLARSP